MLRWDGMGGEVMGDDAVRCATQKAGVRRREGIESKATRRPEAEIHWALEQCALGQASHAQAICHMIFELVCFRLILDLRQG